MITATFEGLPTLLIRKNFVDEGPSLANFRYEATKLAESIHVLISVHADVASGLEQTPRWRRCLSWLLLVSCTAMEIRSDLVAVIYGLSASNAALRDAAEEKNPGPTRY